MVYYYSIVKMSIISFLFIQIVNASPSGMCLCPTCGCSKVNNMYNTMMMNPSPCCCMNSYQNDQNSINLNNRCSCYDDQTNDMSCQSNNIGTCGCKAFSYNTQIPPSVPPASRSSYSYMTDTPSVPCPQTYKNFGYQLQVPVAPQPEPNYGSFDGIIDKTYTKCPTTTC